MTKNCKRYGGEWKDRSIIFLDKQYVTLKWSLKRKQKAFCAQMELVKLVTGTSKIKIELQMHKGRHLVANGS